MKPKVTINGVELTDDQATALRVALIDFNTAMSEPKALGGDATGVQIANGYRDRSSEIISLFLDR